jgi:hypothetical protein
MQFKEDKMGKAVAYTGETQKYLKNFSQKPNCMGAKP